MEQVTAIFDKRGVSKTEGTKRLFEWFVQEESTIQQGVLRQLPEDMAPLLARLILNRMAGNDGEGYPLIDDVFGIIPEDPDIRKRREERAKAHEESQTQPPKRVRAKR